VDAAICIWALEPPRIDEEANLPKVSEEPEAVGSAVMITVAPESGLREGQLRATSGAHPRTGNTTFNSTPQRALAA
jgi:hypothetical protein